MPVRIIKTMAAGLLGSMMIGLVFNLVNPVNVFATCVPGVYDIINGAACGQGSGTSGTLFGEGGIFTSIVNTALFIIGAIAVLMLIYGGIRYTISGGDEKSITAAKNTILYAVVGIVVAVLAYAIINFVLTSLMPAG